MKILTVDVGSTYTKLTAIDSDRRSVLGTAQAFTTIETDVMQGFETALALLKQNLENDNISDSITINCSCAVPLQEVSKWLHWD